VEYSSFQDFVHCFGPFISKCFNCPFKVSRENIMNVYMNIFLLLYADDTVLMTETPEDLQKQLNIFHDYCLAWKLKVNIDKTKIVCFTNG
jgi:hypothetical protein